MGLIVGVAASRNRSGGAKAHLIGILSEFDPAQHGIESVHVWAFRSLLDQLPENSWLVKHNPSALESILLRQLWWQAMTLTREVRSAGGDVLFTTDASTLCRFSPMVALSQDMLSYEPGVMQYFGYGLSRLRLLAILAIQNLAFRRSEGVIFLTRYAGRVIQKSCGALGCVTHIPHGVDAVFRRVKTSPVWSDAVNVPISCI
jgi:hypothetical protein